MLRGTKTKIAGRSWRWQGRARTVARSASDGGIDHASVALRTTDALSRLINPRRDVAAVRRAQRPDRLRGDRLAEELHVAVAEDGQHAAGVKAERLVVGTAVLVRP